MIRRIALVLGIAWAAAAIYGHIERRHPRFARGGYIPAESRRVLVDDGGCYIPIRPGVRPDVTASLARIQQG